MRKLVTALSMFYVGFAGLGCGLVAPSGGNARTSGAHLNNQVVSSAQDADGGEELDDDGDVGEQDDGESEQADIEDGGEP